MRKCMDTRGQQLIFAPGKAIMESSAGQKQSKRGVQDAGMQWGCWRKQATAHRRMELMYEKAYFI